MSRLLAMMQQKETSDAGVGLGMSLSDLSSAAKEAVTDLISESGEVVLPAKPATPPQKIAQPVLQDVPDPKATEVPSAIPDARKEPSDGLRDTTKSRFRFGSPAQSGEGAEPPAFATAKDVAAYFHALPDPDRSEISAAARRFADKAKAELASGYDATPEAQTALDALAKDVGQAFMVCVLTDHKLGAEHASGRAGLAIEFASADLQDWFAKAYTEAAQTPVPGATPEASGPEDLVKIMPDPAAEREAQVTEATQAMSGIVMNGDAPIEVSGAQPKSENAFASRFPGRPNGWPVVMAWPMQPAYRLMEKANASDADIEKYMESVLKQRDQMRRRAEQIRQYILEYNNPKDMVGKFTGKLDLQARTKRRVEMKNLQTAMADTHFGIKWASLLTDTPAPAAMTMVTSWGFNTASTQDGGILIARNNSFTFRNITQQAIALSLHEGQARGWSTFKMQGTPAFARHAIAAAKHMNVEAEITEFYGPWNLFKRRHKVMPAPPGQEASVETEEGPSTRSPAGGAPRPATDAPVTMTSGGIELTEGEKLPVSATPGGPKTSRRRKPANPAADEIKTDLPDPYQGDDPRAVIPENEHAEMAWNNDGVVRNDSGPAQGM